MTRNGKKSEFEFFARNEVGICSDSYHSAQNLLGSAWIPTIPLGSARNVWGRVNYSIWYSYDIGLADLFFEIE